MNASKTIVAPIVDVDYDATIKRAPTQYIAVTIRHAGSLILPKRRPLRLSRGHRNRFNFVISHFLGDE